MRGQVEAQTPIIWALGLFGCVLPALVLMLLVRRMGDRIEPGHGTAAAVTLGLCTMVLPFSTLYFSHVLAALLGFAAFAVLWRERDRPGDGSLLLVALGGLLAGLAFASEYPLALGGAVLGLYAISRGSRVRRGLAYAGGALLGAAPLFAYNLWAFGSLTHLSYANAVKEQGITGHDVLGSNQSGFFGVSVPSPQGRAGAAVLVEGAVHARAGPGDGRGGHGAAVAARPARGGAHDRRVSGSSTWSTTRATGCRTAAARPGRAS